MERVLRALGMLSFAVCQACASSSPAPPSASIKFAVSRDASRPEPAVRCSRTLHSRVSLRDTLDMSSADGNVAVSFGLRGRDGVSVALDPVTLSPRDVVPRASERITRPAPWLDRAPALVALRTGATFVVWTDEASSRVLGQTIWPGGHRGGVHVVSPEGVTAVGSPRAKSLDGQHVVVAYFACTGDGFEVVAASVDP